MHSGRTQKKDPMDKFSKPIKTIKYSNGKLFFMQPRKNPNKPGREVVITYDEKFSIIPKFKMKYSYYVRFFNKENCAGNHYHNKKQEIFIPIYGSVNITIEDIKTKKKEKVLLDSKKYQMFYINSKIAHKVTSNESGSILLVLATSKNNDEDEFKYEIN